MLELQQQQQQQEWHPDQNLSLPNSSLTVLPTHAVYLKYAAAAKDGNTRPPLSLSLSFGVRAHYSITFVNFVVSFSSAGGVYRYVVARPCATRVCHLPSYLCWTYICSRYYFLHTSVRPSRLEINMGRVRYTCTLYCTQQLASIRSLPLAHWGVLQIELRGHSSASNERAIF